MYVDIVPNRNSPPVILLRECWRHGNKNHKKTVANISNWHSPSLAEELGVEDADENDLYHALDWLLERQDRIENKLAKLYFAEGSYAFYDVTSSYYEGQKCPLARMGNSKDKKKGLPVIVYGTLAEQEGRPVSVDVYPGGTGDSKTLADQVSKLRQRFGLNRIVLVGDRGMITQTQIDCFSLVKEKSYNS